VLERELTYLYDVFRNNDVHDAYPYQRHIQGTLVGSTSAWTGSSCDIVLPTPTWCNTAAEMQGCDSLQLTFAHSICVHTLAERWNWSLAFLATHADRQGVDISVTVCLFSCVCLFVCTVTDFSAADKASSVKFCMMVHRRPGRGISHVGELCSPRSRQNGQNGDHREVLLRMYISLSHRERQATDAPFVEYRAACGRIGRHVWI